LGIQGILGTLAHFRYFLLWVRFDRTFLMEIFLLL
jgi:hypothetical protein